MEVDPLVVPFKSWMGAMSPAYVADSRAAAAAASSRFGSRAWRCARASAFHWAQASAAAAAAADGATWLPVLTPEGRVCVIAGPPEVAVGGNWASPGFAMVPLAGVTPAAPSLAVGAAEEKD
jgi:hypothetical protein